MTQAAVKPRSEEIMVSFLVQKKAEGAHGLQVDGKVAEFQSDYPTILTPVDDVSYSAMNVGKSYLVIIRRGSLKTDKEKRPLPAWKDFNYFWDWVRLATTGDLDRAHKPAYSAPQGAPQSGADDADEFDRDFPPPPGAQDGQPRPAREPVATQPKDKEGPKDKEQVPPYVDPGDQSIQRQVALKAAVELAGHKVAGGQGQPAMGSVEVMQVAEAFAEFLRTGKAPKSAQKGT